MRYRGRNIDPIRLWDKYVELPNNIGSDEIFLSRVVCPNPSHDTFKRHFQINVRDGLVHCFAHCGISGTYEHAICVIEGFYEKYKVGEAVDKRDRERRLSRAHKEARKIIFSHVSSVPSRGGNFQSKRRVDRNPTQAVLADGLLEYESFLPAAAREFIAERGISDSSVAKWRLGWSPDELRLVIPAYDERDRLRFLIKRSLKKKDPLKYLYTEGFPKTSLLFGACALDLGMVKSDGLVLVEGSLDTILNHQHGLTNTGGILGTGISDQQVRIVAKMRPRKIYLMFDKDTAGVRNIEIATQKLRRYPLYICRFPKGKTDPAELSRKEAMRSIERAVPASTWMAKNFPNATRQKGLAIHG